MTAHNEEYGISNALGEYLSAVYEISESKPSVRITDVALYMNISKPSVNRAMNSLKKLGYISHEPYGNVYLTDKGLSLGKELSEKKETIARFFTVYFDLDHNAALHEAGKVIYCLSKGIIDKMEKMSSN